MLSYTVFNVEEAFRLVAHCPVRDQGCNHSSLGWAEGGRRVVELNDAARTENRQGGHGTKTGGSLLLDDAQGMGLRAGEKVRFAGSKIWLSCWSTQCFDPVPEAAKFPNHPISAPAS